ncbi:MAG: TetR/AcrR family transcriptional regulator [Clostridiales bacterium]|nr:TetR/AcrR family transcriptional regulator [Clostridiales bacterium]
MTEEKKIQRNTMTKECIFTALLMLMEQMPYDEITITDIAKKAGVSRMSYYRMFKSKDDILIQNCNEVFRKFLERIQSLDKMDKAAFIREGFDMVKENHRLVEGVFHAGCYDILISCFAQYFTYLAKEVFHLEAEEEKLDYWIYGEAGKFCFLTGLWVEKGMPERPEELMEMALRELY